MGPELCSRMKVADPKWKKSDSVAFKDGGQCEPHMVSGLPTIVIGRAVPESLALGRVATMGDRVMRLADMLLLLRLSISVSLPPFSHFDTAHVLCCCYLGGWFERAAGNSCGSSMLPCILGELLVKRSSRADEFYIH